MCLHNDCTLISDQYDNNADMSWEEVRKSILSDLDDFLSNKGVENVMVIEYYEKRNNYMAT